MKSTMRILALLLMALATTTASAVVSVDSMNYPVWIVRGTDSIPLAPGDALRIGDVVQTGKTGRVWLAVQDGSVIKLGQGARFTINGARFRESADQTVLDAAFDLLRGAFRFTSNFFERLRPARHEVDFKVGAVTVGIRGTDIWGLSSDDRDFVALLEGRIEVRSEGAAPRIMEQPLTLYEKNEGEPAGDIRPVEWAAVKTLASDTELDPAAGIANTTGRYDLVLSSLRNSTNVEAGLERFRRQGYAVKTRAVEVGGIAHTRIVLGGLVDAAAGANLRGLIARQFGITDAWIDKGR